jgi:hypothetical protein
MHYLVADSRQQGCAGEMVALAMTSTLIPCADCGTDISPQATSCPKCGSPAQAQRTTDPSTFDRDTTFIKHAVGVIIFVVLIAYAISHTPH